MGNKYQSPIYTAREVLDKYGITDFPVDVHSLCEQLNIRVVYVDFSQIEKRVKKTISGAIQKTKSDKYVILVNETDSEARARFTIAHELGHYFLHMKNMPGKIITSFRMDRSPKETAANKFASELLMPTKLVKQEHQKMAIPVCSVLAQKFNVSKQAMAIRLDELELIYV